jgi:UDP-GlcNAc3NAcA epimerase
MLFSPTSTGVKNLLNEGFRLDAQPPFSNDNPAVFHCGDVMFDNSLWFASLAGKKSRVLMENNLEPGNFILGTIHRDNNTDNPQRLSSIFEALHEISENHQTDVFLPLHPRTSKLLDKNIDGNLLKKVRSNPRFKIVEPVSFLDIIQLEKNAQLVCTDSGGVQKEAYFFKKPCIILRPQTEWVEIVENGTAIIADADKNRILEAFNYFSHNKSLSFPPVFGDGKAAQFICKQLILNK